MNWKKIGKYALSSVFVGGLIAMAVFFPQYYSKIHDSKYLNNVTIVDREKVSMSYDYNTSLESKLEVLMQSVVQGTEFKPVRQTKDNVVSDKTLIEGLAKEVIELQNLGILWMVQQYPYVDYFVDASLYSVKNESSALNPNDNVLFWYMRFSDFTTFDFEFCVDAYDYKIYSAGISCDVLYKEYDLLQSQMAMNEIWIKSNANGASVTEGATDNAVEDAVENVTENATENAVESMDFETEAPSMGARSEEFYYYLESQNAVLMDGFRQYYGAGNAEVIGSDYLYSILKYNFKNSSANVRKSWYGKNVGANYMPAFSIGIETMADWVANADKNE